MSSRTDGYDHLSAPSGRFGGLVRSGRATVPPTEECPQRQCERTWCTGVPVVVCDTVYIPIKTTLYIESQFSTGYFRLVPVYDAEVASTDP